MHRCIMFSTVINRFSKSTSMDKDRQIKSTFSIYNKKYIISKILEIDLIHLKYIILLFSPI